MTTLRVVLLAVGLLAGLLVGGAGDARGACRTLPDSLQGARVVDDEDEGLVEVTAYWTRVDSVRAPGAYGARTLHDAGGGPDGVVRYERPASEDGRYAVYLCVPEIEGVTLATDVPTRVRHAEGTTRVTVDQRESAGTWLRLGAFVFERDVPGYVSVSNDEADGHVAADAVAWIPISSPCP